MTPLYPPPGALDRIRHRARRRKTPAGRSSPRPAAPSCSRPPSPCRSSCRRRQPGRTGHPPIAAGLATAIHPSDERPSNAARAPHRRRSRNARLAVSSALTCRRRRPAQSRLPDFRPTSVTVRRHRHRASARRRRHRPGRAAVLRPEFCTSLAGTSDLRAHWYGVSAPVAPGPHGSAGVSQLRFAEPARRLGLRSGAVRDQRRRLAVAPENTDGQRVIDVEAAGQACARDLRHVHRHRRRLRRDCTSFSLYTSVAGSRPGRRWRARPRSAQTTGQPSSAQPGDLRRRRPATC